MFKHRFELYLRDNQKLLELFEGGRPFIQFNEDEFYSYPFDISQPTDFKWNPDYPNCCEFHKTLPRYLNDWFKRFPNCCERHKKYKQSPWYSRKKFIGVPDKIRLQLSYTEFYILSTINNVDWYKSIIDYIEYNTRSFGSPEVGADRYLTLLEHYIRNAKIVKSGINKIKRKRLLEYFEQSKEPEDKQRTDLNLLYAIFQKWVKTIPNIGYFKTIKEQVANKFPIKLILYGGEYNPFLGETKYRARSKGELIEVLIDITKNTLLSLSNTLEIGPAQDNLKISQLEILEESHRLKQKRLLIQYSKGERKYIKIIKQWLKNEKEYFIDAANIISIVTKKTDIPYRRFENRIKVFLRIEEKIKINNIKEALEELDCYAKENIKDNSIINQITHLQSRLEDIKERERIGKINNGDYQLEMNRIRLAVIELNQIVEKIQHTT